MKTRKPVQPDVLARKVCEDARDCPDPRQRKCRYINRLTPVLDTDKATENGIARLARRVLAPFFSLQDESGGDAEALGEAHDADSSPACTVRCLAKRNTAGQELMQSSRQFAIRYNIRNHTTLKSDEVKKMIAGLIDPKHKVNLGSPDKVILVEIFQVCPLGSPAAVDGANETRCFAASRSSTGGSGRL